MTIFSYFGTQKARVFYPEVALNAPHDNLHKEFPPNRISSTKYTFYTFLPKNLYEQFRYALLNGPIISWQLGEAL